MKYVNIALSFAIIICLAVIALVSFHSVSEIHYLKSFFPAQFTVAEAAHAAVVELAKVALVSFPLLMIIFVCLFLIWLRRQSGR